MKMQISERVPDTAACRQSWPDNVKTVACLLVALGHLMQSMTSCGVIADTLFPAWLNRTLYFFHVPAFFMCSGYLYQHYSHVHDLRSWGVHIGNKLLALGVPYIVFETVVWCIKTLIPDAGNNAVPGLLKLLLVEPVAPYWYLYCLFLLFLVVPLLRSRRAAAIALVLTLAGKILSMTSLCPQLYPIQIVLKNAIWFVLGMCLSVFPVLDVLRRPICFAPAGLLFLALSVPVCVYSIYFPGLDLIMCLLACAALIGLFAFTQVRSKKCPVLSFLAPYIMPIYLMHSIFAATLRPVLLRLNITSPVVHLLGGGLISIFGPILAAYVMCKLRYPAFVLYPCKFIKFKNSTVKEMNHHGC